jgi:phenylalanyl-tRNA synthetase beta chain
LSRYPAAFIDIAVVVDSEVPAATVQRIITEAGEPEVIRARLFDVYQGEQVQSGRKSLAYALALQVPDRTLTDEESLAVRDRIVAALGEHVGAVLRA